VLQRLVYFVVIKFIMFYWFTCSQRLLNYLSFQYSQICLMWPSKEMNIHMHVSGITFIRYAQRMHVSGITFIKPAIVTTSIRQYTGIMRTSFEFLFTVHFILIKLVFSNHVSYVTLFQCFSWSQWFLKPLGKIKYFHGPHDLNTTMFNYNNTFFSPFILGCRMKD
jgi:hypothetical protein